MDIFFKSKMIWFFYAFLDTCLDVFFHSCRIRSGQGGDGHDHHAHANRHVQRRQEYYQIFSVWLFLSLYAWRFLNFFLIYFSKMFFIEILKRRYQKEGSTLYKEFFLTKNEL